ncbi:MAG: hypothetical protein SFY67_10910 [Candidatus Melainabacteria bacterium]|nr:hypothetical protein [Candidatus Melainabacteria bacterium]
MFVLTNVRPIKSAKKATADQRLESSHMSRIRRANSELTLKLGAQPSIDQLSKELNEPTENLRKILTHKPALAAVNSEVLETQYLNQRVAQILSQLSDTEREAIASRFSLDPQTSHKRNQSKISYIAEQRLKKMLPKEEFGNFLA